MFVKALIHAQKIRKAAIGKRPGVGIPTDICMPMANRKSFRERYNYISQGNLRRVIIIIMPFIQFDLIFFFICVIKRMCSSKIRARQACPVKTRSKMAFGFFFLEGSDLLKIVCDTPLPNFADLTS